MIKEPLASWLVNRPYTLGKANLNDSCAGATFHSPTPLMLHEVPLDPYWGGCSMMAWMCATCADNLKSFQCLLVEHEGEIPWALQRQFGNVLRALAMRGWDHYKTVSNGSQLYSV